MPRVTVARIRELFTLDRTRWVLIWDQPRCGVTVGMTAGCINGRGYQVIKIDGTTYKAHVLIYAHVHGKFAPCEIDHENHTPLDNNPKNMVPVTHKENCKNRTMNSNNTSGSAGVHRRKDTGRWQASIGVSGKVIHLGGFTNKKDAIKARKAAERKYGFHANHGKRKRK